MQLYEVFALLAAIGLVANFFRLRQQARELREAREQLFQANLKEAQKFEKQIKDLETGILEKKEKLNEGIKIFRVHDSSTVPSDDDNGDGSGPAG